MGYIHQESIAIMNQTYLDIDNWNPDFSNSFIDYDDYMADFRPISATLDMPVLFYYGTQDWMIGPDHYLGIHFPNALLWPADTGHMPFIEHRDDLIHAIEEYLSKFSGIF